MEHILRPVVHNRFDIEVADARTGEIKQRVTSYNIILDQYFSRLISRSSKIGYIHLGTGEGTPAVSRTSLFTFLGAMANTVVETVKVYPTSYTRRKIVLSPSDYVGSRITEVGFGYSTSSSSAVTHSMLKDSEGNQIAIQKTDTDVLTVYATFYLTIGGAVDGVYVLPSPNNNAVISAVLQDSYSTLTLTLGAHNDYETANELSTDSLSDKTNITPTADQVNRKWQIPTTRWNYNEANSHMVNSIGSPTYAAWLLPNTDIFPQITLSNLVVGVGDGSTTAFACPIPKIVPNSEAVRVDGVLLTKDVDYTIDYDNNSLFYPELMLSSSPKTYDMVLPALGSTDSTGGSSYPLAYPKRTFKNEAGNSSRVLLSANNYYDFHSIRPINTLKIAQYGIRQFGWSTTSGNFRLKMECSADKVNWTTAVVTEAYANGFSGFPDAEKMFRFEDIETRYVRFTVLQESSDTTVGGYSIGSEGTYNLLVGHTTPGLTFMSPPASGAAVEMDCKIDRPLKNENWVLDFGFAVQFERG